MSVFCICQFLATLKIMDYSLLVGIHDVERAEQEEMDVEGVGEEEEYENDGMGGGVLTGSFGTPPDSPGNPLNCGGFFGPGEFDPSVDVYAIKSHDSEGHPSDLQNLLQLWTERWHLRFIQKLCICVSNKATQKKYSHCSFYCLLSGESKALLCVVLVLGAVKKEVYFMAIIDILTHYDAKKKAAHAAKTVKHGVSAKRHQNPTHFSSYL